MFEQDEQELFNRMTNHYDAKLLFHIFFYTINDLIWHGKDMGLEIPYPRVIATLKRKALKPYGPTLDGILLGNKIWIIIRKSGDLWLSYQEKKYKKLNKT